MTPETDPRLLAAIAARAHTVFVTEPWLGQMLPSAVRTDVPVDAALYEPVTRETKSGLRLVFAGDDRPRKGLSVLLDAMELLGQEFSLEVVGPHDRHSARFDGRVTLRGWLDPTLLRTVYRSADVFVSPATVDRDEDGYGDVGVTDGFPSTAARAAMLTECCLVASNPAADHSLICPGEHYEEFPERDVAALAQTLFALRDDPDRIRRVAAGGAERLRARVDVVRVVDQKLRAMGMI